MNQETEYLKKYTRATNYLAAAQIYLQDNFFLERALDPGDIKSRLLGHWGTCPGINFVYAQLNRLIAKREPKMLFILGPGHGFPALQANLFVEGSLSYFNREIGQGVDGLSKIIKEFSWPHGFPSHSNPEAPGVILEGGELGYSLSTGWGAVLDKPDLIACVLIGDGEAETGPMAGAWHLNKLVNPGTNGVVLPILHLNGYKISGPTMFGRMSDDEIRALFWGYGYEPLVVEGEGIFEQMSGVLEQSLDMIRETQEKQRNKKLAWSPRLPMIILKTPKGWTGVKEFNGLKIEGNFASHQVPLANAKTDSGAREALEGWLRSYNFGELFDSESGFCEEMKACLPRQELRMGMNKETRGGVLKKLKLPDLEGLAIKTERVGRKASESEGLAGRYLKRVFELNREQKNFRLMSPDETYSNKLESVFEETTRAWVWPTREWDRDMGVDGRVMEMLSEHNLQGLMQGYVLTGSHCVFASYEAFIQIVASMADQYAKFLHVARNVPWRGETSSLNYLLTSSGWEQEHNGFSHQNPGFVDDMLQRQGCFVNAFFPADANSLLVTLERCLNSTLEINMIIYGKKSKHVWMSEQEARKQLENGLAVWEFASDDDPDIVLACVGDYMTLEVMAAISLIKKEVPQVKVRVVNVLSLSALGLGHEDCRVPFSSFDKYFTESKPVIFNFHGYPQTLKSVLFDYEGSPDERFSVHGYMEAGSTTTPLDMHVRNQTSRYHLLMEAINTLAARRVVSVDEARGVSKKYGEKLAAFSEYIKIHGKDPDEVGDWQWSKNT